MRKPIANAELHLHLEGSLAIASAIEIAAERGHRWGRLTHAQLRREFQYRNFQDFLKTIVEMCRVLSSIGALERAAFELSIALVGSGVEYAEVYCSPNIFVRWGLDGREVLEALDRGFSRGEEEGGARCAVLLDSVRQFGVEAAHLVLDLHEAMPLPRVVGFGLGGDETISLRDFRSVYERARALGLATVAHAGEMGPPGDVADALDVLQCDRIAHGIRAVEDRGLLRALASRRVPLDIAITSNYRTGAARGAHPLRALLDHGVAVTLSTDDRSLFRTDLPREYARARRCGATEAELAQIARNSVAFSFAPMETRRRLLDGLG